MLENILAFLWKDNLFKIWKQEERELKCQYMFSWLVPVK